MGSHGPKRTFGKSGGIFLPELVEEAYALLGKSMATPCAGVRDHHPALAFGEQHYQGTCARKGARTDPGSVGRCRVPSQ